MKKMTEENLKRIIDSCFSISETLKKLEMSITTANYKSFHKAIKNYKIDISHFLGQKHLTGKNHNSKNTNKLEDILIENSPYTSMGSLKKRLIKNNIIEYKCNECDISTWKNKTLTLQLDHINGISNDNRLENLRLLCPNCHSQTSTFAGRNIKRTKIIVDKPNYNYCLCGNEKLKHSNSCSCNKCASKRREKIVWMGNDELQKLVDKYGYSEMGRRLKVSPTSIKNRLARVP